MHFEVTPGAATEPAAVTYCFVNADFPRGGSMGANTTARGCGLAEFDADVKPGGRVAARLKGQAPGPGEKPYSWDLRFNLPIAK